MVLTTRKPFSLETNNLLNIEKNIRLNKLVDGEASYKYWKQVDFYP